jgi:hypothetical protein
VLAEQVRESKTLSRLVDAFERAVHPVQSSTDTGAATTLGSNRSSVRLGHGDAAGTPDEH